MDGWLKGLIAVTCVVVIGGIGYFVVIDRSDRHKSDKAAFRLSDAVFCRARLSSIRAGITSADDVTVADDCFVKGLVSQSDVVDAFEAGTKKRIGQ
ncbi:hypothetical protein ACK9YZ_07090 [Rhizobium sp. ZK1]|uniref:hypothetical protein n=1 Tax=Rhizobium sp. ZK1 TaxID=3389872 RepID=UPI0039F72F04